MKESAVASPYMKLVHAASMSHATAQGALCLQPLGGLLRQELPEVADNLHLLELLFRQLHVVLVLDGGDQLDEVERVGREVLGEALVELHLVRVYAEDLSGELLQFLEIELRCHLPYS